VLNREKTEENQSKQGQARSGPQALTFNLQATKLFFATSATKGGWFHPDLVWFTISYGIIQRLIHHIFLSKMVYLGVKYMTANRNNEFLNTGTRFNADSTLNRCTTLSCITILTSGLCDIGYQENNNK